MSGSQALSAAEDLSGGILVCGYRFEDMMYDELRQCLSASFEMLVLASPSRWNLSLIHILLFIMNFTMKRMGGGGIMGVGKSNAKMYVQKETGITFKDVAGEDEAKESLTEIVDFLHNPGKYTKIGEMCIRDRLSYCTGNR